MTTKIDTVMILAAGLGTRMRHLRETCPKPLVEVNGRSLIDRVLDRCIESGITRAVVNTHYMAEMLEAHLSQRQDIEIIFSREETLLDTAGGTAHARHLLGDAPVFAINSDALWLDGHEKTLLRMAEHFKAGEMRHLLLLHPVRKLQTETKHKGDFFITLPPETSHLDDGPRLGHLQRRQPWEIAPYIYAGIQILDPATLDHVPAGTPLSFNALWDQAAAEKGLYGMAHQGLWFHIGTPEAQAATSRLFAENNL